MTVLPSLAAVPAANQVVPGVLGFLVVAALGVALFFLLRSMNKQLRKVSGGPPWQDRGEREAGGADSGEPAGGAQGDQAPPGQGAGQPTGGAST